MNNKNNTHGGPGRNQGRHPKPPDEKYIPFGLRLPPDVDKWLRNNTTNRSEWIVQAIRAAIENPPTASPHDSGALE